MAVDLINGAACVRRARLLSGSNRGNYEERAETNSYTQHDTLL